MKQMRRFLLATAVVMLGTSAWAQAPAVGCTLEKPQHYLCNRDAFEKRLAEAKTVRVSTDRMDLFAADRTKQLVLKLDKRVAGDGEAADLVFEVFPVDDSGRINFGPGTIPVATLKVIDPAMVEGGKTLWIETLDASSEWPWSADVVELLKQFQRHIAEK